MAATSASSGKHGDSPLRYAVVGTGMMGVEHLHALAALPATEVVALCDPHEPSLAKARGVLGESSSVTVHRSVDDLVAAGGFDVAVVASPNHTHRRVLEPLLRHGTHLLIEKPLCITTAECREIIELERATRVSAVPGRVVQGGAAPLHMHGNECVCV